MVHDNSSGSTIKELIEFAEQKGVTLLIVGAGAEQGKHAALVKTAEASSKVMIVGMESLPKADQEMLNKKSLSEIIEEDRMPKFEFKRYDDLIKPIDNYIVDVTQDDQKQWYERFQKKRGHKHKRK